MKRVLHSAARLGVALLLLLPAWAWAQSVSFSVKGTVTDEKGEALTGVAVSIVELRKGAYTDVRGFYTIEAEAPEGIYTLSIDYVGYTTERRSITVALGKSAIAEDVQLGGDILNLNEVVVTGASPTATRKQLGNSIGVVDARSLEKSQSVNPLGALSGKMAGAQISQNSGDPGGGFTIQLRGVNSIKGSSDPLYIVDGVIVDNASTNVINRNADAMTTGFSAGQNRLVDLNPSDIERIEVLNGASAAALYGSRASNGVVQIFTKQGRTGKAQVEFVTSASTSQLRKRIFVTKHPERFGVQGNDRLETTLDRLTTINTLGITDQQLRDRNIPFIKAGDGTGRTLITAKYPVTRYDYQDDIFRTAYGTDNYLSVRGGTDKSNYFASFGYANNDGIVVNTNFEKLTGRLRLNQQLTKNLELSTGISYTNSNSQDMANGNNFFNPISAMFIIDNVWNINERTAEGALRQVELVRMNPLSTLDADIRQRNNRAIGDIGLKWFPFKGFRINYTFGSDIYALQGNQFQPRVPYAGVVADFFPDGYIGVSNFNSLQVNSDLLASYETKLTKKITSTTTGGYQYQYAQTDFVGSEGRDLAPLIKTIAAASNIFRPTVQGKTQFALQGFFLQETFGIDNQLFVTLAGRVDGSSAFSKENQNNFYPKASVSWVASELFKSSSLGKTLNTLKLRASYGQAGNLTGIGPYDRFNNFPGTNVLGLAAIIPPSALNNPNVAPEVMTETEFGFDLALLRNRVGLNFTYYNQDVTNLAFNRPLPPSIGGASIVTNIGGMTNKGVEILLQTNPVSSKNLNWDVSFNYTANRNKVNGIDGILSLRGSDGTQSALSGEQFGLFFGRYFARNSDGSLLLTSQQLPQPERGLIIAEGQYKEANLPSGALKDRIYRYGGSVFVPMRDANGQPLRTGTQELRKVIGNPYPDWIGSVVSNLTLFKKLTFNFQFDAFMGAEIYNWNRITSNNVGFGELAEKELKGELPRGYVTAIAGGIVGSRIQEAHIEDASYIKLREVGLSYDLGRVGKAFQNLNVALLGRNLVSFDSYQGFDPETNSAGQNDAVRGDDFGAVPIPRSFTVQLRAKF